MWHDQSDHLIVIKMPFMYYKRKTFWHEVTLTQMLKIYFESMVNRDDKRTMASIKPTLLDGKYRLAFEFKWETAQTLKIYCVQVSDRDQQNDRTSENRHHWMD